MGFSSYSSQGVKLNVIYASFNAFFAQTSLRKVEIKAEKQKIVPEYYKAGSRSSPIKSRAIPHLKTGFMILSKN
ncbi:MAG TPA: hypothetical protein DCG57_06500 [Candidatus Riflebacteria bacterium]|jgi:hypothetical protein|nr:hypothetical protein [Candidatus Riflebacteria bacterium]